MKKVLSSSRDLQERALHSYLGLNKAMLPCGLDAQSSPRFGKIGKSVRGSVVNGTDSSQKSFPSKATRQHLPQDNIYAVQGNARRMTAVGHAPDWGRGRDPVHRDTQISPYGASRMSCTLNKAGGRESRKLSQPLRGVSEYCIYSSRCRSCYLPSGCGGDAPAVPKTSWGQKPDFTGVWEAPHSVPLSEAYDRSPCHFPLTNSRAGCLTVSIFPGSSLLFSP